MSPAMTAALARIRAEGQLFPRDGVSISTVAALVRRGLVTLEVREPVQCWGSLGPAGGRNRGTWVSDWTARPR